MLFALLLAPAARAQGDLEIITVRPNFYVLAGAGANIGVLGHQLPGKPNTTPLGTPFIPPPPR